MKFLKNNPIWTYLGELRTVPILLKLILNRFSDLSQIFILKIVPENVEVVDCSRLIWLHPNWSRNNLGLSRWDSDNLKLH